MKISLNCIGKNEEDGLLEAGKLYQKRLKHYIPFELVSIAKPRMPGNQPSARLKESEGRLILKGLKGIDFPILLDVKGSQMDSEGFSGFIQQAMNRGIRHMGFFIGGAYGFSEEVYNLVPDMISLSSMTYSHQIARLVFLEQLYRAMTILHGEPYHHL